MQQLIQKYIDGLTLLLLKIEADGLFWSLRLVQPPNVGHHGIKIPLLIVTVHVTCWSFLPYPEHHIWTYTHHLDLRQ